MKPDQQDEKGAVPWWRRAQPEGLLEVFRLWTGTACHSCGCKSELKQSLKPGGGKYCLFSETVFDRKVVGCLVLIAKAAVPIRENTGAIKSRLASLPGTSQDRNGIDHMDTWGTSDHYVPGKHKEFPSLTNILPAWMVCVTYLLTYAKHTYFITCLCCNDENYFCLWL